MLDPLERQVEHGRGDHEGDDAYGDVDVEHPTPREVVDEEAAEERPHHAGEGKHGAQIPLVLAAIARRDDVADDGLSTGEKATRTDAL